MERTLVVLNGLDDNYLTNYEACYLKIESIWEKIQKELRKSFLPDKMRSCRRSHRSSVLILSEGIVPPIKGKGYILRRFVRRVV